MDIKSRIKELRRQKNLSQTELAVACGWDKDAKARISNYERGVRDPSVHDIGVIANALGVEPTYLLYGTEAKPVIGEMTIPERVLRLEMKVEILEFSHTDVKADIREMRDMLRDMLKNMKAP